MRAVCVCGARACACVCVCNINCQQEVEQFVICKRANTAIDS